MRNYPSEQSKAGIGAAWLDWIGKHSGRRSQGKSLPGFRLACLGAFLILFSFVFGTGDQPVFSTATRHVASPVQPPISIPEPVAQSIPEPISQPIPEPVAQSTPQSTAQSIPEHFGSSAPDAIVQPSLSAKLNVDITFAQPEPKSQELISRWEPPASKAPSYSSLTADAFRVRYPERLTGVNRDVPVVRMPLERDGGMLTFGKFQVGYGRVFADSSVMSHSEDAPAWEERGCLYLKTSFRF